MRAGLVGHIHTYADGGGTSFQGLEEDALTYSRAYPAETVCWTPLETRYGLNQDVWFERGHVIPRPDWAEDAA